MLKIEDGSIARAEIGSRVPFKTKAVLRQASGFTISKVVSRPFLD
jgi:hypothetical protein